MSSFRISTQSVIIPTKHKILTLCSIIRLLLAVVADDDKIILSKHGFEMLQNAISAQLNSKQILPFGFARQYTCLPLVIVHDMLAQRLRRWRNIKTSLFQRVVFAGITHLCNHVTVSSLWLADDRSVAKLITSGEKIQKNYFLLGASSSTAVAQRIRMQFRRCPVMFRGVIVGSYLRGNASCLDVVAAGN